MSLTNNFLGKKEGIHELWIIKISYTKLKNLQKLGGVESIIKKTQLMFLALWFLLRYRIHFFQAAFKQPLKLHLLKTEA